MTLVDKLKEKLHIGDHSKSSPNVPPKSGASTSTSPAVPPKSETNPTLPPKDASGSSTNAAAAPTDPSQSPNAKKDVLPSLPEKEVFDHDKVTVIFVLGGPGAGKGTQCEYLVKDYGFVHLSAGDLLRAEQNREGSEYGEMIKSYIVEGQIVPMEVTVKLLENAMRDALSKPQSFPANPSLASVWANGHGRFLIDGFPRKMDQALKFDEAVCQSSFVLFFATTEKVMLERLLERGKTSGRSDDNEESIKKRFKTFEDTSMPVVDYYREKDKVVEIDSSPEVHVVYENVRAAIDPRLGIAPPKPLAGVPEPIDQSSATAPAPAEHDVPLQAEGDVPVLAKAAV